MSDDLNFQNYGTVQSQLQPQPVTVASTTTIAPTTFLTFITGTVAVTTITPPLTGAHMLALVFTTTAPASIGTTGNIKVATTTVAQNVPLLIIYNPIDTKYYPVGGHVA